ncbi:hypothetical protein LMIY3S_03713 [Labrys miyagiensis]
MSTTFDPSNKASAVTLSGSNKIATFNATYGGVRLLDALSSVNQYCEIGLSGSSTSRYLDVSMVNTSWTTSQWPGGIGLNGITVGTDGGNIVINNGTVGTLTPLAANTNGRACFARHASSGRIGFRFITAAGSVGAWDDSFDPVAGTGGCLPGISGTLYLAILSDANPTIGTLYSAASEWQGTPPSGYTEIGPVAFPRNGGGFIG